jgi:hypothetical protein
LSKNRKLNLIHSEKTVLVQIKPSYPSQFVPTGSVQTSFLTIDFDMLSHCLISEPFGDISRDEFPHVALVKPDVARKIHDSSLSNVVDETFVYGPKTRVEIHI